MWKRGGQTNRQCTDKGRVQIGQRQRHFFPQKPRREELKHMKKQSSKMSKHCYFSSAKFEREKKHDKN